jgi:1-acyl-sn-glycerol-3-phosphate acyltransferase
VDQEGMDRTAIKAVIRLLKAKQGVLIFPEGSRTLDGNLQPGLPGVGLIIAKTLAPVVPLRIFGAHEALPRGGGRLRLARITVVVGEPIYFTASDFPVGDKTAYARASERVMRAIAQLQLE